jgi:hypothetical protein
MSNRWITCWWAYDVHGVSAYQGAKFFDTEEEAREFAEVINAFGDRNVRAGVDREEDVRRGARSEVFRAQASSWKRILELAESNEGETHEPEHQR